MPSIYFKLMLFSTLMEIGRFKFCKGDEMGLLQEWRNFKAYQETRMTLEEILMQANLQDETITKDQALNVPSVSACVNLICDTVASLPIKLYKLNGRKVEEVSNDNRVALLNEDTGDTLDSFQFKYSLVQDFLLDGNGYAYIKRKGNEVVSLHYVKQEFVAVTTDYDPIYKKYEVMINGEAIADFELIKLLRKTTNGATGTGIIQENNKMLQLAWNGLNMENHLNQTGGNFRGFLQSSGRLSQEAIDELKKAWRNLYKNNNENVIILNNGLEFKQSSATSVELQMNENKKTNNIDICKIFGVNPTILDGSATDDQFNLWIKTGIVPILTALETAINKELLLPSEKESFYFAFDYQEIMKGDLSNRYNAYTQAVNAGWISKNEIRYIENLEEIEGLDVVSFSLGEVIYDIKSQTFFTPNTSTITDTGEGGKIEGSLEEESSESKEEKLAEGDITEEKD